jgi:DNA-binding response OmpR family regulator
MSRSLDVTIANIRKKIDKKMIETITNVGYKIKKNAK